VFAVSAIAWTGGSWVQAKTVDRVGPRRLTRTGMATIAGAVVLMILVVQDVGPTWVAIVGWGVGGFGIGLSYSPLSLVVLARAEAGREGFATAAMQLSDALGVAVGTGLGGAIVATSVRWHRGVDDGITLVFAISIALAILGSVLALRIPRAVSADRPAESTLGAAVLQPDPL
jgi:MFS family permease